MKSTLISIVAILVGLMALSTQSYGQKLNFQVEVKMEHLPPTDQSDLFDLQQKVTDYLNNTKWSNENQDIIIDGSVSIIIETVTTRGSEKVYRAQVLAGSPSGENFYDKSCEFTYQQGQIFDNFRTYFDPLLALLDFYTYMVIGGELDTYSLYGGTPFYDKAQDIANQGQISNYATGWTNRLEEVKLVTDADHVALREAKFYYYEGLYFVEVEPNPQKVQQYADAVVTRLTKVQNKRPNSKALKRFLDSHYQEMCKLFNSDVKRENINKMIQIDPRHRETYENCRPSM